MKKLSTCLFLILFSLSAPSFADDIRDFQIEGISIGDSLLDYMSKKEIKKYTGKNYYKVDKFLVANFSLPSFETYDSVQVNYKKNDNKYIIHSIGGDIYYYNNIEDCYKKKDEIVAEISETLKSFKKKDLGRVRQSYDKIGKSYVTGISFSSSSNDDIHVACYDWSEEIKKAKNIPDYLRVGIASGEFDFFINNEAY